MIQVLILGAGTMGRAHAAAYHSMPEVRLAGIADIQPGKAAEVAEQYATKAFSSYEEAKEALGKIDVVDICLPTPLHKSYVVRAADEGSHVICEKPLARTLEDAVFMKDYCRERNVRLFPAHVLRFFPEYVRAKALLEKGAIGEPAVVRASRGGSYPIGWNHWYNNFEASGGVTLDAMIHDLDFLRWCFGDIERVYAKGIHGRVQAQLDYALVTLRFRNGVIAHVEGTWAHDGFSMSLEMAGTTGVIDYDSKTDSPLSFRSRRTSDSAPGVTVPESPLEKSPYYRELEHFISCLNSGKEALVTDEDGIEAVRIALAALESMKTGQPVFMPSSV